MQMTRGMRLPEAKAHVAEKLGTSPADLSDPVLMNEVRETLGFGRITTFEISHPTQPVAIEAKFNVADVLGVPINSVRRFEARRVSGAPPSRRERTGGEAT